MIYPGYTMSIKILKCNGRILKDLLKKKFLINMKIMLSVYFIECEWIGRNILPYSLKVQRNFFHQDIYLGRSCLFLTILILFDII